MTAAPAAADDALALGAAWHLRWRTGDQVGVRRLWRYVIRDRDPGTVAAFVDAVEQLAPLTTTQLATHTQPGAAAWS